MSSHAKAAAELRRKDPILARIVTDEPPFRRYDSPDLYRDLLESIVSQQLSVKAAETIFRRFTALFPRGDPEPRRLVEATDAQLRAAGVSRQKAGYLRNVAAFALEGGMDAKRIGAMTDEEVIAHLTRIKGVGRWTVEMLLMFPLDRPDVFPVDDVGIQQAMIALYGLRSKGRRLHARMRAIAEAWRPHRTLACKYLWRSRATP